MKITGAQEPDEANDDQVDGDDEVQQPGHDKNENSGDQRYQGSKTEVDINKDTFSFQ